MKTALTDSTSCKDDSVPNMMDFMMCAKKEMDDADCDDACHTAGETACQTAMEGSSACAALPFNDEEDADAGADAGSDAGGTTRRLLKRMLDSHGEGDEEME